ncbi:MAG: ATP-dependent DNA helicase RecG [Aquificae bacterium]|nr:ATP-dependent DNA helicase RecG [Aquificota bacterium]
MDTSALKGFIDNLTSNNGLKLRRAIGVGLFLFNKLKGKAPPSLLDRLKEFDKLTTEKKLAILREVRRFLEESERKTQELKREPKPVELFFKPIDDVKLLSKTEKQTLKSVGVKTLYDALFYFPERYEDKRVNECIKTAKAGRKVALRVRVREVRRLKDERYTLEVICEDGTGTLSLKFRYKNPSFAFRAFRKGMEIVVYGKLKSFKGEKYMVHPEIKSPKSEELGKILPVYYVRKKGELQEISSKTKQKRVRKALSLLSQKLYRFFPEYMPEEILKRYNFPDIALCIRELHEPRSTEPEDLNAFRDPYHKRVIYDELFLFQSALLLKKMEIKTSEAPRIEIRRDEIERFISSLPFELTRAQRRAIEEILSDISRPVPMNRLLQGDVGSGKTLVAIVSALAVAKSGYQVAVMVPTEILAHQHYKKFKELLSREGINVALLTGGLTPAQKRSVYRHVREGNVSVLVGTHALIEDKVEFNKLGLVVIDEQHRFGVLQRQVLLRKGKGLYPHCLVMSATPIPRTMALALYGDLDVSVIDELPPGRKSVKTTLFFESEIDEVYKRVEQELKKGGKAYVVYPLVEESEKLSLKSATEEYEKWKKLFPDRKVLLLHGKMPDREKLAVMEEFKRDGDILVSTTVVEVGVDVPEATVMVIEDAHRFGLSQLHQLRGRVGRSDREAYCLLVVPDRLKEEKSDTLKRLRVFVKTTDGFKIAEEDLKLRGPGELIGVSQSGYFGFRVANLARSSDREMLERARQDAKELLSKNPSLEGLEELKKLILYKYKDKLELSFVA